MSEQKPPRLHIADCDSGDCRYGKKPTRSAKQTPAEIIAAMPHTLVYAHTTLYGVTVMPEKHAEDCAVCRLAAANTAYLETVVQVAIEIMRDWSADEARDTRPTVAEVLAAADAKFREGT